MNGDGFALKVLEFEEFSFRLEKHPEFPWKIDVASQEYQFPQMTL